MAATKEEADEGLSARAALIIAAIFVLVVREFVPFGGLILYPFTLFATWVHEMGHGLFGLLTGGSFERLEIFANASGLAYGAVAPGWPEALRAAGGLLAPPIVGASILAFARGPERGRIVLFVLAGAMALSVPIWVRSLAGWIALPLVGALLGALALKGGPTLRHVGAQLLGVLLGLDTLSRVDYLFTRAVMIDGHERTSDVGIIADAVGGHHLLWGVIIAVLSLALLAVGARLAWAGPVRLRIPWKDKTTIRPRP